MIDWFDILSQYDIDVPHRNEFNIKCPFHNDKIPSLSINIKKGVWICHAGCGQGNLASFISKLTDDDSIYQIYQLNSDDLTDLLKDNEESIVGELDEVDVPFKIGVAPDWIYSRGFDKATAKKWGFGVSNTGSLVIPVNDDKARPIGWVCRQPNGRLPKYIYSKGLKTSRILFNAYNILNSKSDISYVCVTEGPLDTIWLEQNNIPSVALFGLHMSREQEKLLLKLRRSEIVLCLDNDVHGQQATEYVYNKLADHCIISTIEIPESYKDVQDIRDSSLLHSIVDNRTFYHL